MHIISAGVAAGNASLRRLEARIAKAFPSADDAKVAVEMASLLQEIESGNAVVAIMAFILGLPSMYAGGCLGALLFGDIGGIIGVFMGLAVLAGACLYIDHRICRQSCLDKLQIIIEAHPNGKEIERKVRQILF